MVIRIVSRMSTRDSITTVMTTDPTTIDRSQPISQAYRILMDAPFHHLLVVDGDEPAGIIATSDILRLVYDVDASGDKALRSFLDHQFTIDDAMSVDLKTLPTSASVTDAAELLSDGSFHSVVIMDDDGSIAGIVTTTDLARYVRDHL